MTEVKKGMVTCGSLLELVRFFLQASLIRFTVVSADFSTVVCDDGDIDVASGTEIVEDTGFDSILDEFDGLIFLILK
jgi:hypothetical protein